MPGTADVVLLFVKHPAPGRVKTRLAPLFGERAAARAYRRLAVRAAAAAAAGNRALNVHVEPAERVADTPAWLGPADAFLPQRSGSLGARMAAAFAEAFDSGAKRVVVVGSDIPGMTSDDIDAAFAALDAHDAVLGPSPDGGYWLLGLKEPCPAIFRDIPWSSDDVLALTRERLQAKGLSWSELRPLRDLDTPQDYLDLVDSLPQMDIDRWMRSET